MKKILISAAFVLAASGLVGVSSAEAAKPKKPAAAANVVITIKNEKSSALVFFAAAEKDVSISANMLKDPVAPNASVKVNIGKACKVLITADFEDESSIEPVEHDFCKDKVLKLTEPKE
jgi:hypothetical protein